MLVTKEDIWTRYFFFFEDGLYKMFLAFNKDAIAGKSFTDFGKAMEAKYGRAKEVFRDEKIAGASSACSTTTSGRRRRRAAKLVDRSEFYGVYCLVLIEGGVQHRVVERRKAVNPGTVEQGRIRSRPSPQKEGGGRDSTTTSSTA